MHLGSRGRFGPELLDDRLTWQNRAVGQLLGITASDQRMPTGHTQVQIFHADSLRSSFLTIRAKQDPIPGGVPAAIAPPSIGRSKAAGPPVSPIQTHLG